MENLLLPYCIMDVMEVYRPLTRVWLQGLRYLGITEIRLSWSKRAGQGGWSTLGYRVRLPPLIQVEVA